MSALISHQTTSRFILPKKTKILVADIKNRLSATDTLILPLEDTLVLLDQLTQFELGLFLLHNRGLNGYWTSRIFQHKKNNIEAPLHPLEDWLLNESLLSKARERFERFKKILASLVSKTRTQYASIPCGLMDDLLSLDYKDCVDFRLVGIDLDPESIDHAKINATQHQLSQHCFFMRRDAWDLGIKDQFDVVTSNGLNMYESSKERLMQLYQSFYSALKENGYLVISFLTPPPAQTEHEGAWKIYDTPIADLKKEFSIFTDIIQANYLNFSTEAEIRNQLTSVGFSIETVQYNEHGVLPIIIAKK